jgi:hypothetical protein
MYQSDVKRCVRLKNLEFTISQRVAYCAKRLQTAALTILVPQTLEKLELLLSMRAEEKIIS